MPAYLDMSKPRCAYEEVSRWNGGEIKPMTRFLVAVTRNALRNPNAAQKAYFESALECTRSLVEFYMYCQYYSHEEDTLNLMEDALHRFHDAKGVFLQFRAGKRLAAEAKDKMAELCKERDAELKANFGKTTAYKQRIRDTWKAIIEAKMAEYIEEGSDFNFLKIHLTQHFCGQRQRFGSLKQWSTEIGESSHKWQIKDGFNASNKTGHSYSQVINYYLRCDACTVRKANLAALSGGQTPDRRSGLPGCGTSVTGAFRPDGLVFTRPCKIFQAKVFKEKKRKDKRIHDNLILLRVTFSIIVLDSSRRKARWVVFAVIAFFCKLCQHYTITPTILETPLHQGILVGTI